MVKKEEYKIEKGKAFLLVGGKAWGKSSTLRILTERKRAFIIQDIIFLVKFVSNGDIPTNFEKFENKVDSPNLITAFSFCFTRQKALERHLKMVKILAEKYELFFWIMKKNYKDPKNEIPIENIELLRNYGEVFLYDKVEKDYIRAERFKKFIISKIRR